MRVSTLCSKPTLNPVFILKKFILMANTIHIYRFFTMEVIKQDEDKVNDISGHDVWSACYLSQY